VFRRRIGRGHTSSRKSTVVEIVYERIAAIDVGQKEVATTPRVPGHLRGSFIPPGEIAAIRELTGLARHCRGRSVGRGADLADVLLMLGELVIDEATYAARLRGQLLELTYTEFELLKYLAQHAGLVLTRAPLLQEIWGYDFFDGTRTVDVHVRRLRAKLGIEHEQMISTVRHVGYTFVRPTRDTERIVGRAATQANTGPRAAHPRPTRRRE
jgi:DNA-binding winged helix-turn-helix (wHTH) protein